MLGRSNVSNIHSVVTAVLGMEEILHEIFLKEIFPPAVMAKAFNLSSWEADLCEFKASLVYKASSRTARARQRNPVSNQK